MNGGEMAAREIAAHEVDALFTLIGGHVSPILVESKRRGIRVVDTRHEVNAVFAADAWTRLKGIPGVAVVTAEPGVPGPVFVELPVDLLYDEKIVREWYAESAPKGKSITARFIRAYLKFHVHRLFGGQKNHRIPEPEEIPALFISDHLTGRITDAILRAERPLILVGSQAVIHARDAHGIADALEDLGIPVYLSGMARGLLGEKNRLQFRQKRKEALREADLIILLGVPADFRLNYGAHINRGVFHINVNLDSKDLCKNKRPKIAARVDPAALLMKLCAKGVSAEPARIAEWMQTLSDREKARCQRRQSLLPMVATS